MPMEQFLQRLSLDNELLKMHYYINGIMQDCNNLIVNTLELLQSYNKPSIYLMALIHDEFTQVFINQLWLSDAIWRHGSGSMLGHW